ncbi:PAS domain-containing protein, partial [Kitasatospora sp. NE20-6]|uniref:PAS domain-containing protein n=1 Tax=Kitasatospora sp. NE20-6 TaxID=2859066 RepID=UPI0038B3561C
MNTSSPSSDGVLADVAAALVDARGVVRWCSPAAADLLGRPADEIRGRSVLRLIADPAERPAALPSALPADGDRPGTGPGTGTARLTGGAGRAVTVRYRVLPTASPSRFLVLAVTADLDTETRQGTALLRALLTQDRIGFVLRDTELAVVRSNPGPDTFAGRPLTVGSRLADVMYPQDAAENEAALHGVLETGEPVVAREQRARTLGDPAAEWAFSVSALRLEDARGRPEGVAVMFTDATAHFEAARRLELRHRVSTAIGRSLDVARTAQDIADVLVPAFGDLAWIDLAEPVTVGDEPPRTFGGGDLHLRRTAVRSAHGDWPAELLPQGAVIPPFPDRPLIRMLQEGRAIALDRAALERGLADPAFLRVTIPDAGHSLAIAPLFARGLVLGVAAVWRTERPEPFDQQDTDLLSEVAAHAALAVDNARRYTREHRAAVALQQRLLPRATTRTTTLETAGHYLPATDGAEIGGDWF